MAVLMEIAWRQGWISGGQVEQIAHKQYKNRSGEDFISGSC
jgi:hypothetical protein